MIPTSETPFIMLDPNQEIRFIMDFKQVVTITTDNGIIFLYGWALPPRKEIIFRDQNFTLTTGNEGCTIKVSGSYVTYYVTKASPVFSMDMINLKPTVLIVGQPSTGKTTLAKWLINTTLSRNPIPGSKDGPTPIYVNADPQQAVISPPGCIGAVPVNKFADNTGIPIIQPLVYFLGHLEIDVFRIQQYKRLIKELALHVQHRRESLPLSDAGVIIDFPAPENQESLQALSATIEAFGVTHIICMGDDRLYNSIKRSYPQIELIREGALPGATSLSRDVRIGIRNVDTKRYFDGDVNQELFSATFKYSRADFKLLSADSFAAVPLVGSLKNSVVAVIPRPPVASDMWKMNAIGFFTILDIGEGEGDIEVLKPNMFDLDEHYLIVGTVKYANK